MGVRLRIGGLLAGIFFCLYATATLAKDRSMLDIEREPDDTNKVKHMLDLAGGLRLEKPDTSFIIANKAQEIASKLNYAWGIGYSLKFISLYHFLKGNYVDALVTAKEALSIFQRNNIKVGVANMLNNIGTIYFTKSLENDALNYYLQSLKISEEINDTLRIATALVNVGSIYSNKSATYDKCLNYTLRSLPLFRAVKDSIGLGTALMNVGELYYNWGKQDSAKHYALESVNYLIGVPDMSFALNLLGRIYLKMQRYDAALRYHDQALQNAREFDSKVDIVQSFIGLASVYHETGNNKEAIKNYLSAEELSKGIGLNQSYDIEKVYKGLTDAYSSISDFKKAFEYQRLLIDTKDKIYSLEVDKKLGTKLFEFELGKKQADIDKQTNEISFQRTLLIAVISGLGTILVFAGVLFSQRNRIKKEKKRSDELLLNILPEETAEELKVTGKARAKSFDLATVMFTDFKEFTQTSEMLSAEELVDMINMYYSEFDRIVERYGLEKIKTIGDSYMCVGGVPMPNENHPAGIIQAALDIVSFLESNKQRCISENKPYFEARLGIHSGPVVAGIVGLRKFAFDIWGDTVNTAARMQAAGEVGKVNISGSTYELVKNKFSCSHRGKIQAKNKGEIDMYFVESRLTS